MVALVNERCAGECELGVCVECRVGQTDCVGDDLRRGADDNTWRTERCAGAPCQYGRCP
ncbi:MAG: hypothetical protein HYV09_29750 [Deltaproteobacteria bacterium]|nr:hypothetical protein [Deltaproteobacteria bacterium]